MRDEQTNPMRLQKTYGTNRVGQEIPNELHPPFGGRFNSGLL